MKKINFLIIVIFFLIFSVAKGQSTFIDFDPVDPESNKHSWDGYVIQPTGEYRILAIFVNIIYDVDPGLDPISNNSIWGKATIEGVFNNPYPPTNEIWPAYIHDYLDVEYDAQNLHGTLTRLYAESSFHNLKLLGDFILVNVKHSNINNGTIFDHNDLMEIVMNMINLSNNGQGLNTVHGYNSILDYSTLEDNKFDHVMFIVRNSRSNYGYFPTGHGSSGSGAHVEIKTSEQNLYKAFSSSIQCVGSMDLNANPNAVVTHEFSHLLFGGNSFHAGGGHSWGNTMCYLGIQYGYSLMGGSSSGLVNCNGYDRYRVGWMHPDNDKEWPITALDASSLERVISDVTKSEEVQSFKLGDFITTGDVIRIQLPYIVKPASNQYIWIENHKILESTLNFLQYENTHECRPNAQKGIYAYYQVGKDTLEGNRFTVYPSYDADNLRFICANGFYDQAYEGTVLGDCVGSGQFHHFRNVTPNPLSGNCDLSSYYLDIPGHDILKPGVHARMAQAKTYYSNDFVDNLPYLMSEMNPFHGYSIMSLNTNPAPFNTTTFYHKPTTVGGILITEPHDSFRNQPEVFLTGLKIEMILLQGDDYQVNVSWNNYDLESEVLWTGSIVLKEELHLMAGSVLLLDQNLTPNTIERNQITGLFSAPTLFRCDKGSKMTQEAGSELIVDNMSTLLVDDGSEFIAYGGTLEVKNDAYLQIASGGYFEQKQDAEIYADNNGNVLIEQGGYYLIDGSDLTIKAGGSFEIENCATLEIINGGRLIIESGAEICIHPGAFFILEPMENLVFNEPFSTGNCLEFTHETFAYDVMAIPPTNVIQGTVNWDGVEYNFTDYLYIEPEAVLNVSGGSILRFAPGQKVIVRRQGTMNISNSVMSNICENQLWKGIEVWGDETLSQLTYPDGKVYQGKLVVRDGSVIENALTGILAGSMSPYNHDEDSESESPGTPIPISTEFNGGIVQVRSSELRNNRTGIYLAPYENFLPTGSEQIKNNASYIKNCDFTLTQELLPDVEPVAFLRLNGVRGIQSYGNHFINASELKPKVAGAGILSLNSNFEVKEHCLDDFLPCQNYRLSRFEKLHYGIKTLGAATAKSFTVDMAEFINNVSSIFTSGINDFTITRNDFEISPEVDDEDHLGLYIEGEASGFHIEENRLTGNYEFTDAGSWTYGVVFNNTGPHGNELYNNHFESLHVATFAYNQNRDKNNGIGLCIKCNEFIDNGFDISVNFDAQLYSWGGIAPNQGGPGDAPDAPAGNRFSHLDLGDRPRDINNQGDSIYYYYHANAPTALKLKPEYYTGVTLVPNLNAPWNAQSCPSNLTPPGGGHDEEALRGMMAESELKADSTQALINMLKDAGDTEALHWDVSMSAPWQGQEVYSELMSVSPYVSDTVLAAAIEKENVLVDAMIRDVLVANPHSAKSGTLMEKLNQRFQPLPGYMLDEILQGQSLVSAYEKLQSSLSYHKQKKASYHKQLVQYYLNDTINPAAAADSLVSLLLASGHPAHWYRAAILRHEQGNTATSAAILNSILSSFNLNAEQLQSHSQLASWLDQENLLRSQEKNLVIPDSAAVVWLFDIMESGGLPVSIFARNILLAHALVEHQPQYLLPDDTKSSKARRTRSHNSPKDEALKLFPNPAREYVIVDFDLSKIKAIDGAGMLKVSAIDGRMIESLPLTKLKDQLVFPLNGYKPGTYVFTLYYGKQMLESKRLIIQ